MNRQSGFTLVELMVVIGIVAVLSAVAVPAYINYQNRARQTDAIEALLRAKMDQQAFFADFNRYANTIGCLYSFGNTCTKTADTSRSYTITMAMSGPVLLVRGTRWVSVTSAFDMVRIAATNDSSRPVVTTPNALKFSVFDWIFN